MNGAWITVALFALLKEKSFMLFGLVIKHHKVLLKIKCFFLDC